jgi:hypothetical protein
MKPVEIFKLMSDSLNPDINTEEMPGRLASDGVSYSFRDGFTDRVIDILLSQVVVNRQLEFGRSLNNVFYRVAFAGVAAIAVLLLSIFLMEGSLTFNSLVGITESFDENLISLLTGN